MDKSHILLEIRRIADDEGGKPPGRERFEKLTGIRECDWYPDIWLRWGDAVTEAGCVPNQFQQRFEKSVLFDAYATFASELGRIPLTGELTRKGKIDSTFPNVKTFSRLGNKTEFVRQLAEYCTSSGLDEVAAMCDEFLLRTPSQGIEPTAITRGFVYMMKSGRHYKIGHTNATGRREYELGIKLPEELKTIHVIKTDDPRGVEAYWHKRFADRRANGEWFKLDRADVAAFKRTKNVG